MKARLQVYSTLAFAAGSDTGHSFDNYELKEALVRESTRVPLEAAG